jgi:hypothetical protein
MSCKCEICYGQHLTKDHPPNACKHGSLKRTCDICAAEAERDALRAENERLKGALTPSAETKAAYMGEFTVRLPEVDDNGEEYMRSVNVPWITIKRIMKAIHKQALAGGEE